MPTLPPIWMSAFCTPSLANVTTVTAPPPPGFTVLPRFDNTLVAWMFYLLTALVAALLIYLGYRFGRWVGEASARRQIQTKENELFTAQRGFKQVYEHEMDGLKTENAELKEKLALLGERLEEYRKKAAGYGGLFNTGGKRADAMYALLLENESLEEALHRQNEKLQAERTDSVRESVRSAGYRRVLMSQLMNDERIKEYVAEILNDDKRLPGAGGSGAGGSGAGGSGAGGALPSPAQASARHDAAPSRPAAYDAGSSRPLPAEGEEVER